MHWLSGDQYNAPTQSACRWKVTREASKATSQICIVSPEPKAIVLPLGDQAMIAVLSGCPCSVISLSPVAASHTCTRPSRRPEDAMHLTSGDQIIALTASVCAN